jgi:hypothetical protein
LHLYQALPLFEISQSLHQKIEIDRVRTVEIILVGMSLLVIFLVQRLIERILRKSVRNLLITVHFNTMCKFTITMITTQGKFKDFTISIAIDDLPDPELPAIPMILRSTHGGEYIVD